MTTFEEMNQIMKANGWVQIDKKYEYEKIKRENKQVTARIGWTYFKLKEENSLKEIMKSMVNLSLEMGEYYTKIGKLNLKPKDEEFKYKSYKIIDDLRQSLDGFDEKLSKFQENIK